jgi:phage shock protein PspC (stress-responsive transcriptional regulator)
VTMSYGSTYGSTPLRRPRWISGVCADIGRRAAVPPWVPRAGFVIFGLLHWVLALILYFVLSHYMFAKLRPAARFAPPPAPPTDDFSGVRERFRGLDERLANLEAATLRSESELRRAFRDLERR